MNVVWLDVVTYLHHHGYNEKVPWYRGEVFLKDLDQIPWFIETHFPSIFQEWNYMRGGLSTIDRDYGIFNKIHHDIGTHVVHHLFPQIPHYNLTEAVRLQFHSLSISQLISLVSKFTDRSCEASFGQILQRTREVSWTNSIPFN